MVFHWNLSDSKSPQVSRTLHSILAVLNNAVVWMVSTRPPTSKSSSPFSNPLVMVRNTPITIGIIVTCMFHNFFNSQGRSTYPSFHILSVLLCGQLEQQIRLFYKFSFFVDYYYYYYYYYFTLLEFFHKSLQRVFHKNLNVNNSPHVSTTHLSIRVDLNITMLSEWLDLFSPIGISVIFMIHNIFSFLVRSKYLFFFFLNLNIMGRWKSKINEMTNSFFLLINAISGIIIGWVDSFV